MTRQDVASLVDDRYGARDRVGRPFLVAGGCWLAVALTAGASGQQAAQGERPMFRGGTDVSRVIVRVLDKDRRPVRGLTARDFSVSVNGIAQPIVALAEEDPAGPVAPPARWMRDVAPDVATNQLADPRLFVIVLDDAAGGGSDPWIMRETKRIGAAIVDQLGPKDLAAVVFVADNRLPQDFTQDRVRLLAAIDRFHDVGGFAKAVPVIQKAMAFLEEVPERRSAIFYVGPVWRLADFHVEKAPLPFEPGAAGFDLSTTVTPEQGVAGLIQQAGLESVPVFPISNRGLPAVLSPSGQIMHVTSQVLGARTIAERTGARAIVDTNAPHAEVPSLFRELSVHYVIGYSDTAPQADGRFRRVQIKVNNRPDLIVEPPERNYFAPTAQDVAKAGRSLAKDRAAPVTTLALAGLIPLADEPLRLAVAPFAPVASAKGPAPVAVSLGIDVPTEAGRLGDTVELETRVFDAEGRKEILATREAQALRPRLGETHGEYDFLSTLQLKPGQYDIRISSHSTARDRSGSVYTDFVVPDFAKAAFSVSGVAVAVSPSRPALPADAFVGLLPVAPTTVRAFATTDRVTVFLRAYSGGNRTPVAINVRAEIRNTSDEVVFTRADTVTPTGASAPRSADYRLELPVSTLPAGDYVLSILAAPPKTSPIRRDVRFSVR